MTQRTTQPKKNQPKTPPPPTYADAISKKVGAVLNLIIVPILNTIIVLLNEIRDSVLETIIPKLYYETSKQTTTLNALERKLDSLGLQIGRIEIDNRQNVIPRLNQISIEVSQRNRLEKFETQTEHVLVSFFEVWKDVRFLEPDVFRFKQQLDAIRMQIDDAKIDPTDAKIDAIEDEINDTLKMARDIFELIDTRIRGLKAATQEKDLEQENVEEMEQENVDEMEQEELEFVSDIFWPVLNLSHINDDESVNGSILGEENLKEEEMELQKAADEDLKYKMVDMEIQAIEAQEKIKDELSQVQQKLKVHGEKKEESNQTAEETIKGDRPSKDKLMDNVMRIIEEQNGQEEERYLDMIYKKILPKSKMSKLTESQIRKYLSKLSLKQLEELQK